MAFLRLCWAEQGSWSFSPAGVDYFIPIPFRKNSESKDVRLFVQLSLNSRGSPEGRARAGYRLPYHGPNEFCG